MVVGGKGCTTFIESESRALCDYLNYRLTNSQPSLIGKFDGDKA